MRGLVWFSSGRTSEQVLCVLSLKNRVSSLVYLQGRGLQVGKGGQETMCNFSGTANLSTVSPAVCHSVF